jgi:hypothetical protein
MAENNSGGSPFQHARRFVPPTSGYMNLADEEYHQYQPYEQVYLNSEHAQPYGQDYLTTDNSAYYNTDNAYYNTPTATSASPTLIASPAPLVATGGVVPAYHTPMKPDQIDQKPNAA